MKEMGGWVDGWMDHLFLRLDENSISPREGGRGEGGGWAFVKRDKDNTRFFIRFLSFA